jgi:hypothetical protein
LAALGELIRAAEQHTGQSEHISLLLAYPLYLSAIPLHL